MPSLGAVDPQPAISIESPAHEATATHNHCARVLTCHRKGGGEDICRIRRCVCERARARMLVCVYVFVCHVVYVCSSARVRVYARAFCVLVFLRLCTCVCVSGVCACVFWCVCGGGFKLRLVWMNMCVVIRMLVRMHVLCFKLLLSLFGWVCSRARILYHVIVCTSQ
jgi:hypothetical protein